MALELIENQLVKLYDTENFNQRNKRLTWDQRQYCQIVREEQKTMFQVRVTEATGEQLVSNHDFTDNPTALPDWYTLGDGTWVNDNGRAYVYDSYSFATITQSILVDPNSYYVIEVKIDEMGYESPKAVMSASPTPDYDNLAMIATTEPGVYKFYFSSLSSTSVLLSIGTQGLRKYLKIDYVTMYKLTTPTVTLETCTGTLMRTIPPYSRELDLINYEVEWLDLPEDCYRVCMTGVDDLDYNYLSYALALGMENGAPLMMEDGGFIKWYG